MSRVPSRRALARLVTLLGLVAVAAMAIVVVVQGQRSTSPSAKPALDAVTSAQIAAYVPPIKHVFVVNIENKGFTATWGDGIDGAGNGGDPYLATTLRSKGVLLNSYYGTAHNSQPNYIAQISGQGPNPTMQADCQLYDNVLSLGTAAPGQVRSATGCIFDASVPNIARQLTSTYKIWRGYMEDMATPCQHPVVGGQDGTQKATTTSQYATRHNPFAYFHNIIDSPSYCQYHLKGLQQLPTDLASYSTTPALSYITPNLCNDGHDAPCVTGQKGGLDQIDAWMKVWIPRILNSPAFTTDGVLIITADESDSPQSDATACCGETALNTPKAGITGDGGGLIGALVISKWSKPGSWSSTPYNHYSLLASLEEVFRLPKIGYASVPTLDRFGLDVYNSGWK